jgi:hypothetical protein
MHTQRWAPCPPYLAWKKPGPPTGGVRVLERHREAVKAEPDHGWLDMPGKVRHVGEHELEFRDEPPRESSSHSSRQGTLRKTWHTNAKLC